MKNSQSAGSQPTLSFSSLLCQEGQTILDNEGFEENRPITEDDDEYVQMLIDREINGNVLQEHQSGNIIRSGNWIKEARLDAIQYIINIRATFGFKIQTAYLAVTYLDRFLSRRIIEGEKFWVIHLLAMACLSLAAKMRECRVPMLSEFPGEHYNFDSRVIQKMELLVLNTLDWRMGLVTPLALIHYFASKFCENHPLRDLVSRVFEVIMVAIRDDKLMHHKPSAMAAAATLLILDQRLTRESLEHKINALTSCGCLKIEDVFSFYNQMKELDTENKFAKRIMSSLLSPIPLQRTKRRSLTFTECDQNSEMCDNKRQS